MKILLIDQDTQTLEMLQISLSRVGYTVLFAADGVAGLRLAQTAQPALIVMDLLLPGIDGMELCHQLDQDPKTKDIPRFLITALSIPDANELWQSIDQYSWQQQCVHHSYLPKPLNLNQFLRKVDAILQPEKIGIQSTGPSVLIITKDDAQRKTLQQAFKEKDFKVYAYNNFVKPINSIRAYPPEVMLLDEDLLTPDILLSLKDLRKRNPTLTLIVLQKEATVESPEYINEVDCFISRPIYPWEVVTQIETTLDYRRVKERTKLLSQQLLTLNKELVDSQQTLQAQNKELDLINRRLHRLSELKETLTGMLVHDLKSPLSAMLGAMQFMTIDPNNTLSEGSRRILGGGLAAGRQMHRLTTTLLDEQKLENNQLVFDIEPTDLEETVLLCQEMMGPLFNMHKVHLEINLPPDLPPLQADPIILQRIIENLLDNAVKYSPANESIFINAALKNDMVEVSITDRGDGVPPEHREAIFERFTQLEHPKFGKIRGSVGLGLSFCKLAVETMGGRIWIDCPEDIGTTFFFTIPASTEEVKE